MAIAEPVSRPEFFHEYEITSYSLHGAFSVGLDATSVLSTLEKLCKTQLPRKLTTFVTRGATRFGRAKLVLRVMQTAFQVIFMYQLVKNIRFCSFVFGCFLLRARLFPSLIHK